MSKSLNSHLDFCNSLTGFSCFNFFFFPPSFFLKICGFFCCFLGSFLMRKIGPKLTSVANLPLFFLSPQRSSTLLYILVVGPSSSSMWDAASERLYEWCVGLCLDTNQRTPGCWSRVHELNHYTMGPARLLLLLSPPQAHFPRTASIFFKKLDHTILLLKTL